MEPQPSSLIEVFYSYSHKDEGLRDQLANHLSMLKHEGVIKDWHDRRISAGQEWDGKINERLNSADIILLLVSSDFLASKYCYDIEVKRAMERHESGEARVIPIILRPCDWQRAPFGKVQGLPKDAKPVTRWDDRDEALLDIARGIRNAVEEISSKHYGDSKTPDETIKPAPHLHIPNILRVPFVARKDREGNDTVERLKDELAPQKNRLVSLWGAGGVGKTAIAVESVRALVDAFRERVVWVSADGLDDFNLISLLDGIATQLRQDELRKLALEQKKEQVRELLMTAPTLVVLDNFETIAPEEGRRCAEWLAQPALCSGLITTRQNIEAAHRNVAIDPMRAEEAYDLLQRSIAEVHDQKAFANLDRARIIHAAEANPLVLQWIVRQIDLAQDAEEVLNDLKNGEGSAVERVFDRSFKLKQLDNGGRVVLLALSLFVPSATRKALAEVAGFRLNKEKDKKRFREAVKTLSSLWLLQTAEAGERLAVEGLTRELTKAHLFHDPRSKIFRGRYVARFIRYAEIYQKPTPADLNALEKEKDNLLTAMDIALQLNDWNEVERIFDLLHGFFDIHGYWDEGVKRARQAVTAGKEIKNESKWSVSLGRLASFCARRGEFDEARKIYEQNLGIYKKLKSDKNVAVTLHCLGTLAKESGDFAEARRLYNESLEIGKRTGDKKGIAFSLHQLGVLSFIDKDYPEAENFYNECLILLRKHNDKKNIAECLESIGLLRIEKHEFLSARSLFGESLEIAQALADKFRIGSVNYSLGILEETLGNIAGAARLFSEALTVFEKLGSPKAEEARQALKKLER